MNQERRNFIKGIAAVFAATVINPELVFGQENIIQTHSGKPTPFDLFADQRLTRGMIVHKLTGVPVLRDFRHPYLIHSGILAELSEMRSIDDVMNSPRINHERADIWFKNAGVEQGMSLFRMAISGEVLPPLFAPDISYFNQNIPRINFPGMEMSLTLNQRVNPELGVLEETDEYSIGGTIIDIRNSAHSNPKSPFVADCNGGVYEQIEGLTFNYSPEGNRITTTLGVAPRDIPKASIVFDAEQCQKWR